MELNKGMYKDSTLDKTPQGGWVTARNIVVGQSLRNIVNERGFDNRTTMSDFAGIIVGYIEMNNDVVFFTQDGTDCAIHVFNDMATYQKILTSPALNFSIDNPIRGDYTYNFKGERIITWWDGLADSANVPKVLNIDCLPFKINVDKEPVDTEDLNLLKLFPDLGCLDITLDDVNDGGGELFVGAYYILRAYQHPDGSITNFTPPSNPIFIHDDDSGNAYQDIDGAEGTVKTSKSITLTLTGLSKEFNKVIIAIIARNGGIISARQLAPISYNTTFRQVVITGKELSFPVAVGTLLTPNASYKRVHTGVFLENRLHLGNLKKETIKDYQPYANNIKVNWVREQEIAIGAYKGSYKDPVVLFDKRGFASDEVYAFYVAFGMKDGTISEWFHIPGADARTIGIGAYTDKSTLAAINATNPSADLAEALTVAPAGKYFHFFNNALSTGEMSFWENEDELYPDTDCYEIKNNLGVITGTLRGRKVRHHKFPSIKKLDDFGRPFYTTAAGNTNETILQVEAGTSGVNHGTYGYQNWGAGGALTYDFVNNPVVSGDFTLTQTTDRLIATVNNAVKVLLGFSFRLYANSTASIKLIVRSPNGVVYSTEDTVQASLFQTEYAEIYSSDASGSNNGTLLAFSMDVGWTIEIVADRQNTIDTPAMTGNLSVYKNNFEDVETVTKAIGVQFSDIYVPAEIEDKVTQLYFGYAARTTVNSTKLSFSPIDYNPSTDVNPLRKFLVRDFDLLSSKAIVNASYFKTQLRYNFATAAQVSQLLITQTPTYDETLRKIKSFQYKPRFYFTDSGETLVEDETLLETQIDYSFPSILNEVVFMSLYQYITNAYFAFSDQAIIVMGHRPIAATIVMYNGDTVLNYLSLLHNNKRAAPGGYLDGYRFSLSYVREGINNSELRHEDTNMLYYPKSIINNVGIGSSTNNSILNYYLYNKDFSAFNNIVPQLIFVCEEGCDNFTDSFPLRIARSLISNSEDGQTSWRTFKINEYYEMKDRDKGEVYRLDKFGGSLMINQLYSFFVAQVKDILYTNDTDIFVSRGDIFDRAPREVVQSGKSNAYAGCQSLWGAKVCKQGYIFVDVNAGKIFAFKGELQEISATGMYHFFDTTIRRLSSNLIDNPFADNGVILGFDGYENRLLFTKLDNEQPYTLSYSFHRDMWIAFHDYLPNAYIDNNKGNFCIRNKDGIVDDIVYSRFYEMNVFNKYARYFNEFTIDVSYIDVVFTAEELVRLMSVYWETEVSEDDNLSGEPIRFNETLTHIMAYDNHRCTGLMTVGVGGNLLQSVVRRVLEGWQYNDLRDIAINKDVPSVDKFGTINAINLNSGKIFYKKSVFIGKFVVVRFQYDNTGGRRVIIKDFKVNVNQSER